MRQASMPRTLSSVVLGMLLGLGGIASTCYADEEEPVGFPSVACGSQFPLAKRLVREATAEKAGQGTYGHKGGAAGVTFLTGELPPVEDGVVVFAKKHNQWVGIAGVANHLIQSAYISKSAKRAFIISMWSVEGPGHSYTIMSTSDGFGKVRCSELEFPQDVESPETFLEISDFNIDQHGRGALVGSAEMSKGDGSETRWYRYETSDWGSTWGPPKALNKKPPKRHGIYRPTQKGHFEALKADLLKAAPDAP